MARLFIHVTGVRQTLEGLTKMRVRMIPLVTNAVANRVAELARENAPTDTGELASSIVVEPIGKVVSKAPWSSFVEFGTKPGYFPNIGNITPWAERHGISPGALATSIKMRGTMPHPFLQPAADDVVNEIPEIAERVFRSLGV